MRDRRARWGDEGDIGGDFNNLRDDVLKLKTDLARAMRNLISAGRGEASQTRDKLEDAIQEKLDRLNSVAENLGEWGRGAARDVRRRVEKHPVQTAAIAIGIGVLIGALVLGARSRRF
jgi:ElaB/YqjD/DUF883 family membrane-anchored ribosome-binding protein